MQIFNNYCYFIIIFTLTGTTFSGFSGDHSTGRQHRDWGAGSTGHSGRTSSARNSSSGHFHYTGGLSEDEQMEYAMRESLRQPGKIFSCALI